jgi:hypothetical protein
MRQTKMILLLLMAVALPMVAFAGTSGPSPVPNPPSFQISTNTLTLCRGVVNYIPVTVSNLGKFNGSITMGSLTLAAVSDKYIVAVDNGSTNLITLPPNTSATVQIPVFVSLNTSSLVQEGISINYNYLNYYSDSEVRNVSFGVESCPSPLSIAVTPKVITSGGTENITVNLTNTGTVALTAISLHLSMPSSDGQVLSLQPTLVGSIAPYNTVMVKESIFVSKNASQAFPINVNASLYNGINPVQISLSPILLSTGIINLSASSITLSPLKPTAGGIFSISFVLTDVGTAALSALTVTSPPTKGFTTFGSNSVFVGDLQVDSQTPATLTLIANGTLKPGLYMLPVKISYLNNLRENHNTTIVVPVEIATASPLNATSLQGARAKGGSGGLIIIILVVLVLVFAYLYYKERKRKPK